MHGPILVRILKNIAAESLQKNSLYTNMGIVAELIIVLVVAIVTPVPSVKSEVVAVAAVFGTMHEIVFTIPLCQKKSVSM